MPFERSTLPGLTVSGSFQAGTSVLDLGTSNDWQAQVDESVLFPTGLVDDVFLHVSSSLQELWTA